MFAARNYSGRSASRRRSVRRVRRARRVPLSSVSGESGESLEGAACVCYGEEFCGVDGTSVDLPETGEEGCTCECPTGGQNRDGHPETMTLASLWWS